MNRAVVVDASVAVKWVIDEEYTDRARALLTDSVSRSILGPPHLASEVTNAVYQRLRRRDITATEAGEALERFLAIGPELLSPAGLYQQAYDFAQIHGLTNVYDSLYAVLALILELELWTDDRTLVRALGPAAPWVRWIGEYPIHQDD